MVETLVLDYNWGCQDEDLAVQDAEWFQAFLGLLGYKA